MCIQIHPVIDINLRLVKLTLSEISQLVEWSDFDFQQYSIILYFSQTGEGQQGIK